MNSQIETIYELASTNSSYINYTNSISQHVGSEIILGGSNRFLKEIELEPLFTQAVDVDINMLVGIWSDCPVSDPPDNVECGASIP